MVICTMQQEVSMIDVVATSRVLRTGKGRSLRCAHAPQELPPETAPEIIPPEHGPDITPQQPPEITPDVTPDPPPQEMPIPAVAAFPINESPVSSWRRVRHGATA